MSRNELRIILVDDHTLFRKGIALYLNDVAEIDLKADFAEGREALAYLEKNHREIDLVIMDLNMPGIDGEEATGIICQQWPELKVLILTSYGSGEKVFQMLSTGASGYLLKDAEPSELVIAIKAVASGGTYFGQQLAAELLNLVNKNSKSPENINSDSDPVMKQESVTSESDWINQELIEPLTERELEVLTLIGQGLANSEIGEQLHISDNTVKTHVSNIFQKLNVSSRTQAAFIALQKGLI